MMERRKEKDMKKMVLIPYECYTALMKGNKGNEPLPKEYESLSGNIPFASQPQEKITRSNVNVSQEKTVPTSNARVVTPPPPGEPLTMDTIERREGMNSWSSLWQGI
jgi:hypothetical protein